MTDHAPPTDPRDISHDDDTSVIAAEQSASRSRVLVPLGTHVQFGSGPEGRLIAATDQPAVIEDADGLQHAERWGHCSVTPAGPDWSTFPLVHVGQEISSQSSRESQGAADPFHALLAQLVSVFDRADAALNALAAEPTHDLADIAHDVQQSLNEHRKATTDTLTKAIGEAAIHLFGVKDESEVRS